MAWKDITIVPNVKIFSKDGFSTFLGKRIEIKVMTQKGKHTWDIVITYHSCPNCGYIIENREKFLYSHGKWQKDFTCPRCQKFFTVTKPAGYIPFWDRVWKWKKPS